MKAGSPQQTEVLTPKAIGVLRNACRNKKTRTATIRNPRAVLSRHGIDLGEEVELRLYERKGGRGGARRHDGDDVAEPLLDQNLALRAVPPGLDAWWRSTHDGCPFGTVRYTMKKKVLVCDVWGVAAGPREWAQDAPGTPFGHWEYPDAQSVCLVSHEEWAEVTECLPRLMAIKAG